jgi:curved DNA-binding protein
MEYKDYYQSLGVAKDADSDSIKRAYRKLAREHHPDLNPGDKKAEERFKEINEAYEVLSDPGKRQKYDQFGSQWQQFARSGGRPEEFNWQQWGGMPGGARTRTVTRKSLSRCSGRGWAAAASPISSRCCLAKWGVKAGGVRALVASGRLPARPDHGCPLSRASRSRWKKRSRGQRGCCSGATAVKSRPQIPRGVRTGSKVRLRDPAAGEVMLKIEVLPHPQFQREGDNLRVNVPVDLYTAVLGGEISVPTLERPLMLIIPPETANGRQFRLRGKGMPKLRHPDNRGDLVATVDVQLPANLSEQEKELFAQLKNLRQ